MQHFVSKKSVHAKFLKVRGAGAVSLKRQLRGIAIASLGEISGSFVEVWSEVKTTG